MQLQTLKRRKLAGPVALRKLEDPFWATEAFEVMFAQVLQGRLEWQIVGDQIVGHVRE
jgi:hypothetical protein